MTNSEKDEIAGKNGTTVKADENEYAEYLNRDETALLRTLQRGGGDG